MVRKFVFLVTSGCLLTLSPTLVRADVFVLRNGNVVYGKWLNSDEQKPEKYRIETAEGMEITIDAKDVGKVEQPSPIELKYLENIEAIEDTAAKHLEVVLWLEKSGVTQLANAHRERIVELDPNDSGSRRKLKYLEVDGEWISEAKYARRYGVVRDGNAWKLSLEAQLDRMKEARKQAETQAGKKVDLAVRDIREQSPRRYEQQLQFLNQLDDPNALPKISNLVSDMRAEPNTVELRLILVQSVARMQTGAAKAFLADCAIFDPEQRIRNFAVDELKRSAPGFALQSFLRHLSSKDVKVIEHAGEALDALGDERAIPFLIEALITQLVVEVNPNAGQTNAGFSSTGGTNFSSGGKPQLRQFDHENLSVLQALQNLCPGINYQFDKGAWLKWYAETSATTGRDLRRDP